MVRRLPNDPQVLTGMIDSATKDRIRTTPITASNTVDVEGADEEPGIVGVVEIRAGRRPALAQEAVVVLRRLVPGIAEGEEEAVDGAVISRDGAEILSLVQARCPFTFAGYVCR